MLAREGQQIFAGCLNRLLKLFFFYHVDYFQAKQRKYYLLVPFLVFLQRLILSDFTNCLVDFVSFDQVFDLEALSSHSRVGAWVGLVHRGQLRRQPRLPCEGLGNVEMPLSQQKVIDMYLEAFWFFLFGAESPFFFGGGGQFLRLGVN